MFDGVLSQAVAGGLALSIVLLVLAVYKISRGLAGSYREEVLDVTSTRLSDMFIFVDTGVLIKLSMVATLFIPIVLLLLTGEPLVPVATAVLSLFGPRIVQSHLKKKRRKTLIRQLPDALGALVGALRSGMSLQQSLTLLAEQLPVPSNQEFTLLVRKLRLGINLEVALEELEQRIDSLEYTQFTTSVRISREVGGNLTEALERLADTMRKKLSMEDKIDALTSQGKLQGIVVGCLPLFLMVVLNGMEPESMAPLFNSMLGYGVLAGIFVLELIGYVMIRKIVNIDV